MKRILVVDDNIVNLKLAKETLGKRYQVCPVASGRQALQFLAKKTPDLILLDIMMPEMDGLETMRQIKANEAYQDIPVMFLTASNSNEVEVECLELGAVDFIAKPFVPEVMLKRIARTLALEEYQKNLEGLVNEKTAEIERLQQQIIYSLANMIESRDDTTGQHVKRTAKYVEALIQALLKQGIYKEVLDKQYVIDICLSAPLHDIGKIAISDLILCKPGKLTPEEFDKIKTHTTIGGQMLANSLVGIEGNHYIEVAKDLATYHHEYWNGKGYPKGLIGKEIPLCARIMAIADVFDALISKRSYKEPMSYERAFNIIEEGSGTQFEPVLAETFLMIRPQIEQIAESFS